MSEQFTILIADRNRHIREFLQRELGMVGYKTVLTNDGREVLRILNDDPPDLLILDLEIPYIDGIAILDHLRDGDRKVPVVVHAFSVADVSRETDHYPITFVEKGGNTIDDLKTAVDKVLERFYPHRFMSEKKCFPRD